MGLLIGIGCPNSGGHGTACTVERVVRLAMSRVSRAGTSLAHHNGTQLAHHCRLDSRLGLPSEAQHAAPAVGKGPYVVATGSDDKTARLWDVASGQCTATLTSYKTFLMPSPLPHRASTSAATSQRCCALAAIYGRRAAALRKASAIGICGIYHSLKGTQLNGHESGRPPGPGLAA